MRYTIVHKELGGTPSKVKPMTYRELMDSIDRFIAFNPKRGLKTDQDKLEYYNKVSFYKVIGVEK